MELVLMDCPSHPLYGWAMTLCQQNFVEAERRDDAEQRRILGKPSYRCCVVTDEGQPVGIAFFWETEQFLYLEHLCVDPTQRRRHYGSRILERLKALGKPVVLEIEPVVDDWTARRREFYRQNGFVQNPYFHIQPKYHPGDEDLELWVLSSGRELTPEEYACFRSFLNRNVGYGA